jgi:hypothetical protein
VVRRLPFLAVLLLAPGAQADSQCHVVTASFVPSDQLQIVGWIEKTDGTYVDTIYITQKVGHYGLGNRPGRFDFNSGPVVKDLWPYGRRITTFPVWAHRHGLTFPEVVFQDGNDDGLSHSVADSSGESNPPYCRPMLANESNWDAGTCATHSVYTDKGVFAGNGTQSLYPPRADLIVQGGDSASVAMYKQMNPFDAVAQATPVGGMPTTMTWKFSPDLPLGDYVLWVEASKAFDFNATFNQTTYPAPANIPFGDYGQPYRGQPSVVYRVPFTVGSGDSSGATQSYVGYGDPAGASGVLTAPDATKITEDTPGSGAQRLQLISGTSDRVEVAVQQENDTTPPAAPGGVQATTIGATTVTLQFTAPGDDGLVGMVTGYDVHYRSVDPMTPDNFDDAKSSKAILSYVPAPAGTAQTLEIGGLLPQTDYWIGVRAYDDCRNTSAISIIQVTTADRTGGYVDACFVATAAYGSRMANDVELLRHYRDAILKNSVLGELAVETYYTFGPPVAGVVGQSELLRAAARDFLAPIVERIRHLP